MLGKAYFVAGLGILNNIHRLSSAGHLPNTKTDKREKGLHHRLRVRCNPFLFRIIPRLPLKELSPLPALLQLLFQEALTVFGYITAGKDVGNGYPPAQCKG